MCITAAALPPLVKITRNEQRHAGQISQGAKRIQTVSLRSNKYKASIVIYGAGLFYARLYHAIMTSALVGRVAVRVVGPRSFACPARPANAPTEGACKAMLRGAGVREGRPL